MARKAKPTSRTTLRYVAFDDGSIGLEGKELVEAYGKYMSDLDEEHLKLRSDEAPSFYHFKILPFDLQVKIRDTLTVDEESEGATSADIFLSPAGQEVLTEFLDRCLIGVDSHPYADAIQPDGTLASGVISWSMPAQRPAELTGLLLSEEMLSINMFWFVFRASQLTETEKKR